MFKKAFWVPYEDSANYPTLAKTMEAISKYCEENGKSYTFINDDEVEINGKRYHHILDKTTGFPVRDKKMVVVICEDAFLADLYSTAFFTMPVEKVMKFAESDKKMKVLVVDKDMKILKTKNLDFFKK